MHCLHRPRQPPEHLPIFKLNVIVVAGAGKVDVMPRIAIKFGDVEVEYEGDQKFIAGGLIKLVREISASLDVAPDSGDGGLSQKRKPRSAVTKKSTSSIAQLIGVKTGSDLVIAASAHLSIVKQKEKYSYKEILAEMRDAKTFYKSTYHNNLGNALKSLVGSGRLNHLGGDDYALAQAEIDKIEGLLA